MQQTGDIAYYVSRLSVKRDFEKIKLLDEVEDSNDIFKSIATKNIKNPYIVYNVKRNKSKQQHLQRMRDYRKNNPEKMKVLRDKNAYYLSQWRKDNAEKCRNYTQKYKEKFIMAHGIQAWRDKKNNNAKKLREKNRDKNSKSA
jgi:hypothetical protein